MSDGPTKDEFERMMLHEARDPHAHARIDILQESLAKMLAQMDAGPTDTPEKIAKVTLRILEGMRLDDEKVRRELGL